MASKSLNLLLISALGAMAVGILAYNAGWVDAWLPDRAAEKTEIAGQDAQGGEGAAASGESQQTAGDTPAKAEIIPPRFDIVRVESNGNVVIAGNAAAESVVEVITGTRVLGETKAGSGGDFAVVLAEPLAPGDYTVVLRATLPDDIVAMSAETAIISVPETETGEVLAIVDEPGKPSKLITVPEGEKVETADAGDSAEASETADADGAADTAGEKAETEVAMADNSATESAAEGEAVADADADVVAAEGETAAEGDTDQAAAAETAETQGGDASASTTEAEADAGSEGSTDAEAAAGDQQQAAAEDAASDDEQQAVAGTSASESIEVAAADANEESAAAATEDAAAPGEKAKPEAASEAAADLMVQVEAVEIEGDHVFVAGSATPGKVVRVYANNDLIGEARVSEAGRFLVESGLGLAVGEYIIRADLLNVGSADVIARAAVPFEREAGETVAAVAPKIGEDESESGSAEEAGNLDRASSGDAAAESDGVEIAGSSTDNGSQAVVADADGSTDEVRADAASSETEMAAASAEEPSTAGEGAAEMADADDRTTGKDDRVTGKADDTKALAESVPADGTSDSSVAGEEPEIASAKPGSVEPPKPDEEVVVTAPKLEKSAGSVIIRRGDTLWQISRRVYGRGIRYTTIYTANRNQIENPHRIWPGQVFEVPGESSEGEKADFEAIADQMPEAGGENETQ